MEEGSTAAPEAEKGKCSAHSLQEGQPWPHLLWNSGLYCFKPLKFSVIC